jgi:hypothetical protein
VSPDSRPKLEDNSEITRMCLVSVQKDFKELKRNGNLAFKRWAICVGSIYGLVTCLVAGMATLLVVNAQPITPISTGYSPRVSQASVTTRYGRQFDQSSNGIGDDGAGSTGFHRLF